MLQKTGGGNTAATQYLNGKPCSVSANAGVQSTPSPQGGPSSNPAPAPHGDPSPNPASSPRGGPSSNTAPSPQGGFSSSLTPSPQGGSSSNVIAIIGGLVGGIAALAALAAAVLFLVLRRRRSGSGVEMTPISKAAPGDDKVGQLGISSDN